MATAIATTHTRPANNRGRGGGGGNKGRRGRGGSAKHGPPHDPTQISKPESVPAPGAQNQVDRPGSSEAVTDNANTTADAPVDDGAVCWICAEPVKYWSVSECNHRTCHVCALRLRALYKKLECTFCKEPQPSVIFTASADALWSSYTPENIPYKDAKLSVSFETQEMMEETLILLRFNCPDAQCDFIGNGWADLKLHTRATHGKLMCDICIRFKKVFAHEHALYDPNVLPIHVPSMARGHRRDPKQQPQIEGGVHPLCEFCRECFFGDDELYAHMREKHEECFVCKRNEIKDQYFRNYEALEEHFMHAHFPCRRAECLARKFVVFGSAIDLKAHQVEEHGAEMSARDKRDARRVDAQFEFEDVGVGAGRRGRRDRGDREREREPPPHAAAAAPPGGGASISRPQAAGARRREAFGGNLTTDGPSQQPSRRQSPSPDSGDADPRLATLVSRLAGVAPNPTTAVPAVKAAIRSYRGSESGARDLISTVWNILDRNLDGTASIVNTLVDLVEEEDKKRDLLSAWNGFKVEQRNQFPELVPTTTGSEWAGVTSGRVLNAKHSTATRSSAQSSRQLWDRVARAAAASTPVASSSSAPAPRPATPAGNAFPPLHSSSGAGPSGSTTPFRQPQRATPWASSGAGAAASSPTPTVRAPTSVPGPGARAKGGPATFSKSAFPELPTSNSSRVPKAAVGGNQSLRNILGSSAPAQAAWGGESGPNGSGEMQGDGGDVAGPGAGAGASAGAGTGPGGGSKKKGKGKQKQTLFTLGSFPA